MLKGGAANHCQLSLRARSQMEKVTGCPGGAGGGGTAGAEGEGGSGEPALGVETRFCAAATETREARQRTAGAALSMTPPRMPERVGRGQPTLDGFVATTVERLKIGNPQPPGPRGCLRRVPRGRAEEKRYRRNLVDSGKITPPLPPEKMCAGGWRSGTGPMVDSKGQGKH